MRRITKKEVHQRGCEYCTDHRRVGRSPLHQAQLETELRENTRMKARGYLVDDLSYGLCCIHEKCPYKELDDFKSYKDYLEKTGGIPTVKILNMFKGRVGDGVGVGNDQ